MTVQRVSEVCAYPALRKWEALDSYANVLQTQSLADAAHSVAVPRTSPISATEGHLKGSRLTSKRQMHLGCLWRQKHRTGTHSQALEEDSRCCTIRATSKMFRMVGRWGWSEGFSNSAMRSCIH